MRKRNIIVVVVLSMSMTVYGQTNNDVLHELLLLSKKYETGINVGYGFSVGGVALIPLGLGMTTAAITLSNLDTVHTDVTSALNVAGYSMLGVGLASFVFGIIFWRNQEQKYIDIIDRQYRYRDFINNNEISKE